MKLLLFVCMVLLCISCTKKLFNSSWTAEKAPSTYTVRFETTKGDFDVEVQREWSPLAADRFYQLVKHRFYDSAIFYRVVPNFVAQFSSKDYAVSQKWMKYKIPDEPTLHSNKKGALSFARSGKETRGDALFINLKDNSRLDTVYYNEVRGFPAFGDVVSGMDVVSALYSAHGDKPMYQDTIRYTDRTKFFSLFPGLDLIRRAYVLKK